MPITKEQAKKKCHDRLLEVRKVTTVTRRVQTRSITRRTARNASEEQPLPNQEPEPEPEHCTGEASGNPVGEADAELCQAIIKWDNGQKRVRLEHKLSMSYPNNAVKDNEEDEDDDEGLEECRTDSGDEKGKKKRKGRGPSKPRDAARREDRPTLKVVGDWEFEATPRCSKIHATMRMLLFKYLSIPARTYNIIPSEVRSIILKKFLKVYRWEAGQMRHRCIDVFENIAADVYRRSLVNLREKLTKEVGESPSLWKGHPPQWCTKKVWVWEGLCDLFEKEGWQGVKKINTSNKAKDGGVANHVAGPRTAHQVKQLLVSFSLHIYSNGLTCFFTYHYMFV